MLPSGMRDQGKDRCEVPVRLGHKFDLANLEGWHTEFQRTGAERVCLVRPDGCLVDGRPQVHSGNCGVYKLVYGRVVEAHTDKTNPTRAASP